MKKAIVLIMTAVILMLGACSIGPKNPGEINATQSPLEEQDDSIEAAVEGEKIISGEAGLEDEEVPQSGETILSQSVENSVKSPSNNGAYFYVRLMPNFDLGSEFMYEGKAYEDWWHVPALETYNSAYEAWIEDVYPTLDEEMKAAELRGEEQAQGWEKHNPQDYFDIYYEHTQSDEVISAWKAALDKAQAAKNAYHEWLHSDIYNQQEYDLLVSEHSRLKDSGYLVELSGWVIRGYMTQEQIQGFDCGNYGYTICWADKDDPMDD